MESQANQVNKKKRGRKPMAPEKKRKGVTGIFSPEILAKINRDIEKEIAETQGQRIVQIVEKFYADQEKKQPPW
jgi:hypothetical protein